MTSTTPEPRIDAADLHRALRAILALSALWEDGHLERAHDEAKEFQLRLLEDFVQLVKDRARSVPVGRIRSKKTEFVLRLGDVDLVPIRRHFTSLLKSFQASGGNERAEKVPLDGIAGELKMRGYKQRHVDAVCPLALDSG